MVLTFTRRSATDGRKGDTMKTGDFRFWHSRIICWWLFALFAVLTIIWQLIDVKPYPHMNRDFLTGTIVLGGLTVGFFILARRAKST